MFLKRLLYILVLITGTFDVHAQNCNNSVGTPQGRLAVSDLGAAVYNLDIDVPDGGSLTPQIGLCYNSQMNGYGLAGYGINITGLSCITRGGKDLFHDGEYGGVTYRNSDNFLLDGKRLILKSGVQGENNSTYTIDGDPYTQVTLLYKKEKIKVYVYQQETVDKSGRKTQEGYFLRETEITTTYFEVVSASGTVTQYGYTHDSRFMLRNNLGMPEKTVAWYINQVKDNHANRIEYTYHDRESDHHAGSDGIPVYNDILIVRPKSIRYGLNAKSRGITNSIDFEYQNLGSNSRPIFVAGKAGKMDACLASITTRTDNELFRKYTFSYDISSDATDCKWTRLVKIEEENGGGEKYKPIEIDWDFLKHSKPDSYELGISLSQNNTSLTYETYSFISSDLNKDGISDIIQMGTESIIGEYNDNQKHTYNYLLVYNSRLDKATGDVSYGLPIQFKFDYLGFDSEYLKQRCKGCTTCDIDGDGYNDIVIPISEQSTASFMNLIVIPGSELLNNNPKLYAVSKQLKCSFSEPLVSILDVDGDGIDEIVYIENKTVKETVSGVTKNVYPCLISKYNKIDNRNMLFDSMDFSIECNQEPRRLFTGDYNSDGLTDLFVLLDNSYKILYNNGGNLSSAKFSDSNSYNGTSMCDHHRVEQGDFNGDGQLDFVYACEDDSYLYMAINNNGTFTKSKLIQIAEGEQTCFSIDDDKYSIKVLDANHDGCSDVMICKADYDHHGLGSWETRFHYAKAYWLFSDGQTLNKKYEFNIHENDALERSLFLGDFDGDGFVELANRGNLLNEELNEKSNEYAINVYKVGSDLSQLGKITRLTDGLGNKSEIKYSFATNPDVYSQTDNTFALSDTHPYTVPLSVVSCITGSNGVAGSQTVKYSYENLLVHTAGCGMLGFNGRTIENATAGAKESYTITRWSEIKGKCLLPGEVESVSIYGGMTSSSKKRVLVAEVGNNYFPYCSSQENTDFYDNKTTSTTQYNTDLGVIILDSVSYDDGNMYKKVLYSDYERNAKGLMPGKMTTTSKHSDDREEYITETTFTYDIHGNVLSFTRNANTDLALTTVMTYDDWGNQLSSVSSGYGVVPVAQKYEYDATHRFVVKNYTDPSSSVVTYTHDKWGNVISETDCTNPSSLLVTRHKYDGWGREVQTITAEGDTLIHELVWASKSGSVYYAKEIAPNTPSSTVWFDGIGRELLQESKGPKGINISVQNFYDGKGQLVATENKTGTLCVNSQMIYDELGRLLSSISSSGDTVSYSYSNRVVSETVAGRTYTTTSDAWGNPHKIVDPINGIVEYAYNSMGKPSSVKSNGTIVSMMYDAVGNRIGMNDPDAGTMEYTYAADGTMLSQTDARNITTRYSFDNLGRVDTVKIGDKIIVNEYGNSGNDKHRLKLQSMDGNVIEYTYDEYGHVIEKNRTYKGHGSLLTKYAYNKSQIISTTYPGGLVESYVYDSNGFKIQTKVGDKVICNLDWYDGLIRKTSIMDKLKRQSIRNNQGYMTDQMVSIGNLILDRHSTTYEHSTKNLLCRQRLGNPQEVFGYDELDRLKTIQTEGNLLMSLDYAANGNILRKSDVGSYTYDANGNKPHAVKTIDNPVGTLKNSSLKSSFNELGRVQQIIYDVSNLTMDIVYGPDLQRWYSELLDNSGAIRTSMYAENYERITDNGVSREFYYLDGNVIVVRENGGEFVPYHAFKDNLGSFLSIIDCNGDKVFDADYDAWGKQTVHLNEIGFQRGYTGHEMWNEFGIINMNGRLYDPTIARFLSPDNYVQAPDNSQSFNRYSYCLNNPLKYNDPSGEFWEWIIAGAIMGAIQSGAMAEMNEGKNFWSGAWKGAIVGAGSATAGMGVGAAVSSALGSTGAIAGFASGFAGGAVSGFASGTSSAWLNGASFKSGLQSGLYSSAASATMGGIIGGIHGGLDAYQHGGNFWTGRGATYDCLEFDLGKWANDPPVKYSNEEAQKFSDMYFHGVENVDHLYADGSMPEGYRKSGTDGYVYNRKGQRVAGSTIYNGIGKGSNVYLYETSFSSKTKLYLTMGHEYMHAYYNSIGMNGLSSGNHDEIYRWQSLQAYKWNAEDAGGLINRYNSIKKTGFFGLRPRYESFNNKYGQQMFKILEKRPWVSPF